VIPVVAHDLTVAFAAGCAFTLGALTPLAAAAGLVTLIWKARK
jgi:hypothetical protein